MEIQDTIDAYVKGQLNAAEKADFETTLQSDPDLAKAVEQARIDVGIANLLIDDEVRGWMQEWENEPPASTPNPPRPGIGWKWLGLTAFIAVLGGAVWFFNRSGTNNKEQTPEQEQPVQQKPPVRTDVPVVQQETVPPKTVPEKSASPAADARYTALAETGFRRSDNTSYLRSIEPVQTQKTPLHRAAEAMDARQYDRAIDILSPLPSTDPEYIAAQTLLGESYFLKKQFSKAEQAYTTALRSGKISSDAVEWSLLMSYLAQYTTKKSDFDRLLNRILADLDHPEYDQAVGLQKALKK